MARKVKQAQLQEDPPPNVESITDLVEISVWLGTFRERMRLARTEDPQELTNGVQAIALS